MRVARGKITEYHTRALSHRPKATDVLFRACKHGSQPAAPHQGGGEARHALVLHHLLGLVVRRQHARQYGPTDQCTARSRI